MKVKERCRALCCIDCDEVVKMASGGLIPVTDYEAWRDKHRGHGVWAVYVRPNGEEEYRRPEWSGLGRPN